MLVWCPAACLSHTPPAEHHSPLVEDPTFLCREREDARPTTRDIAVYRSFGGEGCVTTDVATEPILNSELRAQNSIPPCGIAGRSTAYVQWPTRLNIEHPTRNIQQ